MNVVLVSQCSKNALTGTRRILDQFAERIGERTWQTPITAAGLDTLRRLLRRIARKNTAVACHWIKGRDHSELLWVVGDASRFGLGGAVPTNSTQRDVLRSGDENDWHTGEDIRLLAALAALFHDLGKACAAFQQRLFTNGRPRANRYRHEWISLRLFQAFVGEDDDHAWLQRLHRDPSACGATCLDGLVRDGIDQDSTAPLADLPELAAAVGWLIVSHHRLPERPSSGADQGFRATLLEDLPAGLTAEWNQSRPPDEVEPPQSYWQFEAALPVATRRWQQRASRLAERMLARLDRDTVPWLDNPYAMHLARMSLMLADHHYSSLEDTPEDRTRRVRGDPGYPLFANIKRTSGQPNQPLDEHILGVEAATRAIAGSLPTLDAALPRLARHKGLRKRSPDRRFAWQDRAFDLAASLREPARRRGFFGVNMASTGCGKTIANGRIAYALADPNRGARFAIALGLRTLTLQTGQVYRRQLGLGADDLAVRVGGPGGSALFDYYEGRAADSGSASRQDLVEEDSHVHFDGDFHQHPILRRLGHDSAVRALIAAPVLVSTIDHLVPATEGIRGGRQIAPMLRLLSSDLVLDEVDDFGLEDLPALARLVHWCGMLGGRLLLSSATLPPALVEGLFRAYRAGREVHQKNRGEPGEALAIPCAWFDEEGRAHVDCPDEAAFRDAHTRFAAKRQDRLARRTIRRRGALIDPGATPGSARSDIARDLASVVRERSRHLHERHHTIDPRSGRRVSFGLVRMAHIEDLVETAQALAGLGTPEGVRLHLCVYHARFPAAVRSAIEHQLDRALDRREETAVFDQPDIRGGIDTDPESDHIFVVLGSPVTEVGRDHDYDWAVVEPSSMRSLIQLAGRVLRHRDRACDEPNVEILRTNLRALRSPGNPAFCRPGFEGDGQWRLHSHDLRDLLRSEEYTVLDARPRTLAPDEPSPRAFLSDLEHARLAAELLPQQVNAVRARAGRPRRGGSAPALNAATWYAIPRATLSGDLPRHQPFRRQMCGDAAWILMPDEAGEDWHAVRLWYERGRRSPSELRANELIRRTDWAGACAAGVGPWARQDYMTLLAALAEEHDLSLEQCARRFGRVTLPESVNADTVWEIDPWLGIRRGR